MLRTCLALALALVSVSVYGAEQYAQLGTLPFSGASGVNGGAGWTNLTPVSGSGTCNTSATGTYTGSCIIYVSQSTGNDGNSCAAAPPINNSFATPCKTLAHAYAAVRNNKADWVVGLCGDTWTGEAFSSITQSGVSSAQPMVFNSYGACSASTPYPLIIASSAQPVGFNSNGGDFIAIMNWKWYACTRDPNATLCTPSGTDEQSGGWFGVQWNPSTACTWVLIEGMNLSFAIDNIVFAPQTTPGTCTVRVRRNVVTDSYSTVSGSQGMYLQGLGSILVEENVFDHNGWNETVSGGGASIFSQNIYISCNNASEVVTGNISTRASNMGLEARNGGTTTNNLLAQNNVAGLEQNCGSTAPSATTTWSYNVAIEGQNRNTDAAGIYVVANGPTTYDHNIVAHATDASALWAVAALQNSVNITAASPGVVTISQQGTLGYDDTNPAPVANNLQVSLIGPLPTGLTMGTTYWVENFNWAVAATLNLSLTNGGATINTSGSPCTSGSCTLALLTDRATLTNSIACDWAGNASGTVQNFLDASIGTTNTSYFHSADCNSNGYSSPNRTLGQYYASVGNPGGFPSTTAGFISAIRKQSLANFNANLLAVNANCYIQTGFGFTCPGGS